MSTHFFLILFQECNKLRSQLRFSRLDILTHRCPISLLHLTVFLRSPLPSHSFHWIQASRMLFIAALLLLGASVALASTTTSIGTSVRTDFCRTLLASAYDGPIPTTTHTLQVTWPYSTTSTSTSIPTKTVTPEPCTQIITHFSTKRHTSTATVATNTVSTTKLVFTVKTVTDYETQTGKLHPIDWNA